MFLLSLEADKEHEAPIFLPLTKDGRLAWEDYTRTIAAEVNHPDFADFMRGFYAKMRGYGGRLALIVHLPRVACHEASGNAVDGE